MEIDARLLPSPLHGSLRHAAHLRDLGKRKTAKELQVDGLRQLLIDGCEIVQGPYGERAEALLMYEL